MILAIADAAAEATGASIPVSLIISGIVGVLAATGAPKIWSAREASKSERQASAMEMLRFVITQMLEQNDKQAQQITQIASTLDRVSGSIEASAIVLQGLDQRLYQIATATAEIPRAELPDTAPIGEL